MPTYCRNSAGRFELAKHAHSTSGSGIAPENLEVLRHIHEQTPHSISAAASCRFFPRSRWAIDRFPLSPASSGYKTVQNYIYSSIQRPLKSDGSVTQATAMEAGMPLAVLFNFHLQSSAMSCARPRVAYWSGKCFPSQFTDAHSALTGPSSRQFPRSPALQ